MNYFGGVKIKKKLKGHIKNISENNTINIDVNAIQNDKIIKYNFDNTKNTLNYKNKKITLKRENNEMITYMSFVLNKTTYTTIYVKNEDLNLELKTKTTNIKITENTIIINYIIEESNTEYELYLVIGD